MTTHNAPIRHRPFGDGHPYAASPDQRVPASPQAGEPFAVGVLADADVTAIVCQIAGPDGTPRDVPMAPGLVAGMDPADRTSSEGAWRADLPPLSAAVPHRYRFVASGDGSGWVGPWYDVSAG
ncbi:MAG: hypothetical protein FWF28_05655, partial [Micrococcales bacterium]|nr:hypothetical protein [Micrococcales bacterium]